METGLTQKKGRRRIYIGPAGPSKKLSHYARGYGPREHGKIRGGKERYQPLMTYSGEIKQGFRDFYLLWHDEPIGDRLSYPRVPLLSIISQQNPSRLAQCPAEECNLPVVPRIEFATQHLIMMSIDDAEFFGLAEFCV
jgi:hypothetical protein